jgi:N-acetylglucosaminyldiphosphoundecaprenol N-acetyl-beta-D-mannosaminyltransferase
MSDICKILGVPFNNVSPTEAEKIVFSYLNDENSKAKIYTPNPEMVMEAQKNPEFMQILNESTLTVPDGIGIIYGSKFTKNPIKDRVAGYDLVQGVFDLMKDTDKTVYFFGGAPGVTDAAKTEMEKKHKGLKVVGTANGYFDEKREQEIISEINEKKPDLLLVGIGFPKQEKWIHNHINELNGVKAAIGVGGSFDVMSGRTKRAPEIFQKLGLEWFYRLITQPTRAGRMLQLPIFMLTVMLKNGKYKD